MYYCATCHQSETLSATIAARQDRDGRWEITSDAEDQITFCDHCNQDDRPAHAIHARQVS